MSDILTTQQAADLAGVDRETIIRAAKSGRLPHDRRFGVYAFLECDVLAFGTERQRTMPDALPTDPDAPLNARQTLALYNDITGSDGTNPYQVIEGMKRRGYPIGRTVCGNRIQLSPADVRAYAKDKLQRPRLPSPAPNPRSPIPGSMTPAQAHRLYNKLTGEQLTNPGTIVSGMERRGFPVQRDKRGRITMREADVRAYIADKLERPNLRKAGKSITISPPPAARNGRVRSTIEAVREAAEGQGYEVVQRRGYVELLRGPRFRPVEPEFVDIEFIPTGTGVQARW